MALLLLILGVASFIIGALHLLKADDMSSWYSRVNARPWGRWLVLRLDPKQTKQLGALEVAGGCLIILAAVTQVR